MIVGWDDSYRYRQLLAKLLRQLFDDADQSAQTPANHTQHLQWTFRMLDTQRMKTLLAEEGAMAYADGG